MGRTCKFRCDESWTKAKAEIWLPLLDRGSIELGCDALAGSLGIDRFLQVCDRIYFPCSASENASSFVQYIQSLSGFCFQFKQHRHLDVTIMTGACGRVSGIEVFAV